MTIYQYIGESSRSTFERGMEHLKDLEYRRVKSHILRHCEDAHPEMNPDEVKFGMKQLSSHRTAFERQIREAVLIDENNGPTLLNSKLEYTRCCIPKMTLKLGNKEEPVDQLKLKEKGIIEKLKLKYKGENKRQVDDKVDFPVRKRSKVENGPFDDQKIGPKSISTGSKLESPKNRENDEPGITEESILKIGDILAQTVEKMAQNGDSGPQIEPNIMGGDNLTQTVENEALKGDLWPQIEPNSDKGGAVKKPLKNPFEKTGLKTQNGDFWTKLEPDCDKGGAIGTPQIEPLKSVFWPDLLVYDKGGVDTKTPSKPLISMTRNGDKKAEYT